MSSFARVLDVINYEFCDSVINVKHSFQKQLEKIRDIDLIEVLYLYKRLGCV